MAFLSTSSAAYACTFVILGLYLFYNVKNVSKEGFIIRKKIIYRTLWMGAGAICVLAFALLSSDSINYFLSLVDALIFQKHNTASYIERSSWTSAALNAFVESFGLGIGVGSVRTSNFFANVLASTGVPGASLFFIFLFKLYQRRAIEHDTKQDAIVKAGKFALIPMLASLFLVGTTPDFGIIPAVVFAMIVGMSTVDSTKSPMPSSVLFKQSSAAKT